MKLFKKNPKSQNKIEKMYSENKRAFFYYA